MINEIYNTAANVCGKKDSDNKAIENSDSNDNDNNSNINSSN